MQIGKCSISNRFSITHAKKSSACAAFAAPKECKPAETMCEVGEQQQPQHSASGGMKRSRDSNQNHAAADLQAIRRHCTGPSQFSHFVFTSLKDAIREWNETRDSKARNELSFNILATVRKWSNPKESKGVNSSIYVYRTLTCGLKDQIHMSRQRCCRMSAITPLVLLFSLTPKNAPKHLLLETRFV